ncbi:MAG: HDIG domain-containing protein [Chloroflexi bacterium OHK40]
MAGHTNLRGGWAYRVRQFIAAVRARVSDTERAMVAATLTPAELRLFAAMPPYDQRHCLDVHHTLVAAGHRDPLLLRAALFHDCGKLDDDGRPMPIGWYVAATLLKRAPALYLVAARICPPVRRYAEHAWRGARMAAQAGSPPEIVAIIRHYHDPTPGGRAALLKWADEQH